MSTITPTTSVMRYLSKASIILVFES
jgi:hypothetical protein